LSNLIAVKRKTRKGDDSDLSSPLKVSDDTIADLTSVFKLLADKSRLKIVLALAQQGPMHVSALCKLLGQTQPAVSHHLTLMRIVGLVGYDRNGKHNYYYLASDYLRDLFEQFFAELGGERHSLEFDEFSISYARRAGV
jgi:ArsR family transcriptional regulator, arsenate/arsenite/antimonite-responsive transcriptional repressor